MSEEVAASTGPVHQILQPNGWPRARGYAYGMAAEGRIVVTGGVVGWDRQGRFAKEFVDQARQAFSNIRDILSEAGAEPAHMVRLTWYVTDIDEYLSKPHDLGAAYRDIFGRNYPAMAVMQVVRLVEPEAKIEVEATAIVPFATP